MSFYHLIDARFQKLPDWKIQTRHMRKKHREELHKINNKLKKEFYYENAARELIGFKYENHSAWVIQEFGDPFEGIF